MRRAGPVDNSSSGHALLRSIPTGAFQFGDGFWGRRQRINRERSLPHGFAMLEQAGNLDNLRHAAAGGGTFRGPVFMDSDVYKWLEACAWELGSRPDPDLQRTVDGVIDVVAAAQAPDGYINSYWQLVHPLERWTDVPHGHELYCIGHLLQAGIALSRTTGDDRLLHIAERAVQCVHATFGEGRRIGVPGHPEIESALVELYRHTGDASALELAGLFLDHRGRGLLDAARFYDPAYYQDRVPIREATTVEGHAVRAVYLLSGVVDVYLETGEDALLASATRQWQDMISHKQYITGAIGARHFSESFGEPYELPNASAYAETCAAIGNVFWNWRMLLATGESRYADQIEWTLYNAMLSGIGLDGTTFFYENPLSSTDGRARERWYECACCPPNVMRLMASLAHYVATGDEHGVQIHQFAAGTLRHGAISLALRSDYPWDGTVTIEVLAAPEGAYELSIRIPGWCLEPAVSLNGSAVEHARAKGYATFRRAWAVGDTVVLTVPMPVQLMAANPVVESTRASVAIVRGPLVYCIEDCDQPHEAAAIAITVDPEAALLERSRPDLLGGAVVVTGPGHARFNDGWDVLYRPQAVVSATRRPVALTAIPYFLWANRSLGSMTVWIPTEAP